MKKCSRISGITLVALMAVSLILAACNGCGSGGQSGNDDSSGASNNTGGPVGGASAPAKGSSFIDSDYGTTITRITDKTADGYSGAGIENEYARTDPENSDGTYLVLRGNDGEWYLYNASTFAMKQHLTNILGGGQEPEPRWDSSDPKSFYFLYGMELRKYNVDTDASTTVYNFKPAYPNGETITTQTEGDASLDQRYWCFEVKNSDSNTVAVMTYDKLADVIIGNKTSFPDSINWVSMDMSGKHCIIGYDGHVAQVFPKDFSSSIDLPDGANGHMDLAETSDGTDVMVYQNNHTDWISMANLNTGAETALVEIPFSVNTDIEIHISGNCSATPGWAVVSTAGSKNPPDQMTHSWMDELIFMVELKANPTIRKLANNHAYTSLDYSGEKNYFAEAFATINKEGTKIYFGSNWGDYTAEYSDEYVLTVPSP